MEKDSQKGHSNAQAWMRYYLSLLQKEKLYHFTFQDVPSLPAESKKLADLSEVLGTEREQLHGRLTEEREHVGGLLGDLQSKLCSSQAGASLVDELASLVGDIESALSTLQDKHKTQYGELVQQEIQLTHDLELFLEDLERDSAAEHTRRNPHTTPSSTCKHRPSQAKPSGLLPEVTECDEFVAQHGHSGGWDEDVHQEFLRVLKACGGDYGHAALVCCEMMIGFTRQDIIQHARWHQQYAELQLRKRVAVAAWRAQRDEEQQAEAAVKQLQQQHPHGSEVVEAEEEEIWRQQAARALQKQQLEKWREQKKQQQKEEAACREAAARSDLARKDQQRRERQELNKRKLEEYKKKKAQEQRAAMAAAASAAPQAGRWSADGSGGPQDVSPDRNRRVAARNVELLKRLQQLRCSRQQERDRREAVQERIRQQVVVEVARDPDRLLQPTTSSRARVESDKDDTANNKSKAGTSGFVLHIPHLQTPAWLRPAA